MQMLQLNGGSILYIDYIVHTLGGDLNKSSFKVGRERVANIL